MAITVKHTKVSTIPDDADTSLVRPSDWNATHTLVGVGTMAEQNADAVAITGGTITGATLPTTSLTGTVTSAQIAATGVAAATYGTANTYPIVTVNTAGQITAVTTGTVPNTYQGTWNASTNSPTIVSSVGTAGYYYVVATAGNTTINGVTGWVVGDWIAFNGSIWQKVPGASTGTVTIADIGYAANQLPLNQYLGRLAYQDDITILNDLTNSFVIATDIGNLPYQIPLNQYLGSMAWQDPAGIDITGGTVSATMLPIQPTPTALTGSVTLTAAQIQTQIITVNSATAVAITMPLGTVLESGITAAIGINASIDFWMINIGSASGAITVTGATGTTLVGSGAIAINTSAQFRLRKTAIATYTLYRLV